MEKQYKVVYQIACSCGKVYNGEMMRRLETRMNEYRDACEKVILEKSAVAKNVWGEQHSVRWEETLVLGQGKRPTELLLKETLHIQVIPAEEHFNRDEGLELPNCWLVILRRLEGELAWVDP